MDLGCGSISHKGDSFSFHRVQSWDPRPQPPIQRMPDPQMHAPGYQNAHLRAPAGWAGVKDCEVFRYNRVIPCRPPDPSIRPNEADLTCPPDAQQNVKRPELLPAAGGDRRCASDRFVNYSVRPPAESKQCPTANSFNNFPCSSIPPITFDTTCPCSNRRQTYQDPLFHLTQGHGNCRHIMGPYRGSDVSSSQALGPSQKPSDHTQCSVGNVDFYPGTPGNYTSPSNSCSKTANMASFMPPGHICPSSYPSSYICRPVYNWEYLVHCPQQDGPPADSYTFL